MGSQEVNGLEEGVMISFDLRGAGTGLTFPVGCGVTMMMAAWAGFLLANMEMTGTEGLKQEDTVEQEIDRGNNSGKAEMYDRYFLTGHLLNTFSQEPQPTFFCGEPRHWFDSAVGLFTAEQTRFPVA